MSDSDMATDECSSSRDDLLVNQLLQTAAASSHAQQQLRTARRNSVAVAEAPAVGERRAGELYCAVGLRSIAASREEHRSDPWMRPGSASSFVCSRPAACATALWSIVSGVHHPLRCPPPRHSLLTVGAESRDEASRSFGPSSRTNARERRDCRRGRTPTQSHGSELTLLPQILLRAPSLCTSPHTERISLHASPPLHRNHGTSNHARSAATEQAGHAERQFLQRTQCRPGRFQGDAEAGCD